MPADDDMDPVRPGRRIEGERLSIVKQEDAPVADLDEVLARKRLRPLAVIDVAADRAHGRDGPERIEHLDIADITRVQDERCAIERVDDLGTEQPVGVGDERDSHAGGSRRFVSARCTASTNERPSRALRSGDQPTSGRGVSIVSLNGISSVIARQPYVIAT